MSMPNWEVDVYLICGFTLTPDRQKLVSDALPDGVGLEVWNDATPLGYDRDDFTAIQPITRSLARQHRFVLKDKLYHYDFFSVFEDDMVITSDHISNFIHMSRELHRLTNDAAPGSLDDPEDKSLTGPLTAPRLRRMIPGFIRVEVLKEGSEAADESDSVPVDWGFASHPGEEMHVNPTICCSFPKEEGGSEGDFLETPQPQDLMVWETGIRGFSVRQLPLSSHLGWVALQPGPGNGLASGETIGGYWSGSDGDFGPKGNPPRTTDPQFFGQQGGFMASREQILFFEKQCPGRFLPPFDLPLFKDDGLVKMNVEFFSGGFQLFGDGKGACNLQRIISLNPEIFSKQLLFHAANNKQLQISKKRRVRADNLFGQLNAVKKRAEKKAQ